jgi:hypothetical protein
VQIQKKSTAKNNEILLAIFNRKFGAREPGSITSDKASGHLKKVFIPNTNIPFTTLHWRSRNNHPPVAFYVRNRILQAYQASG